MLKLLKQLSNFSVRKLILITALSHFVLFSLPINIKNFVHDSAVLDFAIKNFIFDTTADLFIIYLIIAIIAVHKYLFSVCLPLIFMFSAAACYFMFNYKMDINPGILNVVFGANKEQISLYVGFGFWFYEFCFFVFSFLFVWLFNKKSEKFLIYSKIIFYSIVTFIIYLFSQIFSNDAGNRHLPYNYIYSSYKYFTDYKIPKNNSVKINIAEKYNFDFKKNDKDLTIILVIGESARSDHFSLNGYFRDTNPKLSLVNNLISFKNVYSCSAMTTPSVSCILTRANKNNLKPIYNETSIISIFKKLGFKTYWLGVPTEESFDFKPFYKLMKNTDEHYFLNKKTLANYNSDLISIPYLEKILKDKTISKKFIIIHTIGSHWPYTFLVEKEYLKYKPTCGINRWNAKNMEDDKVNDHISSIKKYCDKPSLINSYDNSILYTDYFLNEVITTLDKSNDNAMFLYVSDHGQSLGENGYYLQGNEKIKEQMHIPMLFWSSEKFRKTNKEKIEKIKNKTNNKLTHENIFHSLLDCLDIESKAINKQKSICND